MPQNGFHGLVGLAVARQVAPRVDAAATEPFVIGVTLGAMLPDIDAYPTAIAYLVNKELTYAVHRTFTHSLLAIAMLTVAGAIVRRRAQATSWVCFGLALGITTHVFLDVFFWLAQIDLFWPFSHFPRSAPLAPIINLWSQVELPPLFGNKDFIPNFLAAVELAAFALYLMALRRVTSSHSAPADGSSSVNLNRWAKRAWAGFAVALVGAFTLSGSHQQILVHAPYLLAFLPYWLDADVSTARGRNDVVPRTSRIVMVIL